MGDKSFRETHILLLDDNKSVLEIEQRMFEKLNFHVTACSCGTDALRAFTADPGTFDLVVTDYDMPDIRGDCFARKISELNPDMPIIICTGFSDDINVKSALGVCVKGILEKPFTLKDISRITETVLKQAA